MCIDNFIYLTIGMYKYYSGTFVHSNNAYWSSLAVWDDKCVE